MNEWNLTPEKYVQSLLVDLGHPVHLILYLIVFGLNLEVSISNKLLGVVLNTTPKKSFWKILLKNLHPLSHKKLVSFVNVDNDGAVLKDIRTFIFLYLIYLIFFLVKKKFYNLIWFNSSYSWFVLLVIFFLCFAPLFNEDLFI